MILHCNKYYGLVYIYKGLKQTRYEDRRHFTQYKNKKGGRSFLFLLSSVQSSGDIYPYQNN